MQTLVKKEHPILFSTPMVQAILEGRKTQTRRIIKESFNGCLTNGGPHPCPNEPVVCHPGQVFESENEFEEDIVVDYPQTRAYFHCSTLEAEAKCPYGKVGDVLWVRESWRKYYRVDEFGYTKFDGEIIEFAADNPPMIYELDGDGCIVHNKDGSEKFIPWKPSIHMPKSACRLFLEITDIRVERLQEITTADAVAEGVEYDNIDWEAFEGGELVADYKNYTWRDDESYEDYHFPTFANPIDSFRTLWQSINGEESWTLNPWVWVISFQKIQTPHI